MLFVDYPTILISIYHRSLVFSLTIHLLDVDIFRTFHSRKKTGQDWVHERGLL